MRLSLRILVFVCVLFVVSDGLSFAGERRRPGAVVVQIRSDASPRDLKALNAVFRWRGAKTARSIPKLGLTVKQFPVGVLSEEALAAELVATGAVEFAEPDWLVAPTVVPNDTSYSSQWQHPKIGSPTAWNTTTGSSSVLVAVCDTGVSSNHPDLAANLLLPGYNAVDGGTNTEPVYNHGTGVAGCIGAVGNNSTGVAGVAWNVRILPVRITNSSDGRAYISDAADGIRWAADQGAKVVNLSYLMAGSSTIDSAAQYLRGKGGLLFVAAGNDGQNPGWADYPSFVAVAATTSSDTKASFSNYGTFIDIAAPGVSVYSTSGSTGYSGMSGTSFASPITAGVAALVYSVNTNFTPTQVESFLFSTATDLGTTGEDDNFGHGRVNAAAAVAAAANSTANLYPTAVVSATPTSGTAPLAVSFSGTNSSDSDGSIISWAWNFGDGATGSGSTASHTYTAAGTYTATLTVTDNAGATDTDSATISVAANPTLKIHVKAIEMSIVEARGGLVAQAVVTIVDQAGNPRAGATVTGDWTGPKSSTSYGTTGSDGKTTLISLKAKDTFTYTLTVRAVSSSGYTYDASSNVETSDSVSSGSTNTPPSAQATASPTSGAPSLVVAFDGTGSSDSDGSIVSWAWDFGDGSSGSGATASHTYNSVGTFYAKLTVTDDGGAKDTADVTINVTGDANKVVYSDSVVVTTVSVRGGQEAVAKVTVKTLNGGSTAGAVVTGSWSGLVSGTATGTVGADGTVTFTSKKSNQTGTITFTVTGITLSGYTFSSQTGDSNGSGTLSK